MKFNLFLPLKFQVEEAVYQLAKQVNLKLSQVHSQFKVNLPYLIFSCDALPPYLIV